MEYSDLEQICTAIGDQLKGLQGQINVIQQAIILIHEEMQKIQQNPLQAHSQVQPEAQQLPQISRPQHSLPHPQKFNLNNLNLHAWIAAMQAKLAIDGRAIGNAEAQFYYVYLHLDNNAQATVLPQLAEAKNSGLFDYNAIIDSLTNVYNMRSRIHRRLPFQESGLD